jgi:hypothetical protein
MADNRHFKKGRSTFVCITCERTTRDTGQDVDHLCEDCFEIAGLDNQVNDSGEPVTVEVLRECNDRLAKIKRLGGNVERVKEANRYVWPVVKVNGKDIDLHIPDFLQRKKDGSLKHPRATKKAGGGSATAYPKAAAPPSPLEDLPAGEFKTYVEGELRAGRVQEKWLADGTTISLLEREFYGKRQRREEGLAKLRELGEARKAEKASLPSRPSYGEGVYVVYVNPVNPRKEGTGAHGRYDKLLAYFRAHPQPTVVEVLAAAGYRKDDLEWDVQRGAVKTDVKRKEETPSPKPEPKPKKVIQARAKSGFQVPRKKKK